MNKKTLISLSIIGAVAAIAIGGTVAYFSDTETSVGNTFKAGKFNLKVDSTCEYNGKICTNGLWGNTQEPCACAWSEKDLNGELFFNLSDVKPGDSGEDTISLHVDNNDAWMCAQIANLKNFDNGCEKPEDLVDDPATSCGNPGEGQGELQNYLKLTLWKDDGAGEEACNNILDAGEEILVNNQPISAALWPLADASTGKGPFVGDKTYCIGAAWNVPIATGNIIQTDSVTADMRFVAVQARNMDDFICSSLFNEVCDGIDNDYNGTIDDNWPTLGQACSVGVGVCSAAGTYMCDANNASGPVVCSATAGTANTEICINGKDDDCDGVVDTDCECAINTDCNDNNPLTFDTCSVQKTCEYASTAVCGDGITVGSQGEECDDGNTVPGDGCSEICTIQPGFNCAGQPSVCTPIIDLCNGVDENGNGADGENESWLGQACDGSDPDLCEEGVYVCQAGAKVCNDNTPNSTDNTCNGVDEDCNGKIDDGGGLTVVNCGCYRIDPSMVTTQKASAEICNAKDDNCNGSIDEGVKTTYYRDSDADTYGNLSATTQSCAAPSGYVANSTDCNDSNAAIRPGATENTGDGVDQNCDGKETCYQDNDNDGYRTNFTMLSSDTDCFDSGEAISSDAFGDCDDSNYNVHPWAQEYCNGVDEDCDGLIDDSFAEQWTDCRSCSGPGVIDRRYQCVSGALYCPPCP